MGHGARKGRRFIWRTPGYDEEVVFDLLVSKRWTAAGICVSVALGAVLAALPYRTRKHVARRVTVILAVSGFLALLEGLRGAAFPVFKRVELCVDGLPRALDGFTLAQLTDLHLGNPLSRSAVEHAVADVRAAEPQVIVLTGDYVASHAYLPLLRQALRGLRAPFGLFASLGNHDHRAGAEAVVACLEDLGVTVLVNDHRTLSVDEAQLVIAGVDEPWYGAPDLGRALAGAPDGAPIVLLAHAPDYAENVAQAPIAIQLAGHTHAGHVWLPGLGPLLLPRHGIRFDRGLHRVGRIWLYVSHGLGGRPIRLGSRAEATLFTLRRVVG